MKYYDKITRRLQKCNIKSEEKKDKNSSCISSAFQGRKKAAKGLEKDEKEERTEWRKVLKNSGMREIREDFQSGGAEEGTGRKRRRRGGFQPGVRCVLDDISAGGRRRIV